MSLSLRLRAGAFRALATFGTAVFNYRLGLPGPDAYFRVDSTLPAEDKHRGQGIVGVQVYLPPEHPRSKRGGGDVDVRGGGVGKGRAYRVVINFHGGGFVIGSATDDLAWCRLLTDGVPGAGVGAVGNGGAESGSGALHDDTLQHADDPGAVVFSIDYRLAPAHPFPIPLEDCVDAILAVLSPSNIEQYSLDPARVALSGFSAGGNLALAAWTVLQDPSLGVYTLPNPLNFTITGICLFYPVLDFSTPRAAKLAQSPRPDLALPAALTELFDQSYLPPLPDGASRDRADPLLSPGLMSDAILSHLPPTHMVLCEYDSLIHEARTFAARAKAAGRDVRVSEVKGARHGWDKLPGNKEPEVVKREYETARAALCEFAAGDAAEAATGTGTGMGTGRGAVAAM